ncbi:Fatty acid desaturase [Hyella patelloides LEGE 07179]|uniref:Fatty acid desaturase n=1 Tax=Hyella patelloides LEGE 07179 TaxID=945734 RepID=A0A563VWJ0_9CYAN|nr:fatty acid desaturase [Hyella patelloides]VEP15757.1 Fatty acid desaturase [Hyella patelloides LEGE 07179]
MTTKINPVFLTLPFAKSDWRLALFQLINTLVPYTALWALAAWEIRVNIFLTILTSIIASGFYIRIFIIFHDCGHGSFSPSKYFNNLLGFILGMLFFVPYRHWTYEHALHHSTSGNLDHRGRGDVWTMTLSEYHAASLWLQQGYRLYRSPITMILADMVLGFIILFRLPQTGKTPDSRWSIFVTNIALVIFWGSLVLWLGIVKVVIVQGTIFVVGSSVGIFLFFVQHTFEGVYWARDEEWDFHRSAMEGTSFFNLPRILHFFTGHIGYHHIHHLNPKVPNYHLRNAHLSHPIFLIAKYLTIKESFRTFYFKLWNEKEACLCSFPENNDE